MVSAGCSLGAVDGGSTPTLGMSKVQIMFGVASQDIRPEVPAGMPVLALCHGHRAAGPGSPRTR